jgi:hypothetical protein
MIVDDDIFNHEAISYILKAEEKYKNIKICNAYRGDLAV